jgi:flavin reductase (DIM6/NTAB) family NADH-FMN oxidoreductase RutF
MFYETASNDHGLPHDPLKSCIVPRPIGWISTIGRDGVVNLAPYSFFNGVSGDPPMVMFAAAGAKSGGLKDSVVNSQETGEFVVNITTWDLREEMNTSSASVGPEVDEMELAGLASEPSQLVKPPRVKASPIHLECRYHQSIELPAGRSGGSNVIVIGRVVGVHISDDILTDGMIDVSKFRIIARLGYNDYTAVDSVFTIDRPAVPAKG